MPLQLFTQPPRTRDGVKINGNGYLFISAAIVRLHGLAVYPFVRLWGDPENPDTFGLTFHTTPGAHTWAITRRPDSSVLRVYAERFCRAYKIRPGHYLTEWDTAQSMLVCRRMPDE